MNKLTLKYLGNGVWRPVGRPDLGHMMTCDGNLSAEAFRRQGPQACYGTKDLDRLRMKVARESSGIMIGQLAECLLYEGAPMKGSAMRIGYALNKGDRIEVRMVRRKPRGRR